MSDEGSGAFERPGDQPPGYPPPGYPPPGYPPSDYPPPGYPPPGYSGSPYDAAPRGTDGFAIASLVFGLISGVLFSIVFGFIALRRIRRSGQAGRGMAIAGIVLGFCWLALIGVVVVLAIANTVQRNASGEITRGGEVTVQELREGDCVAELDDTLLLQVPVTPCDEPHAGQVYGILQMPGQAFPGDEQADVTAEQQCLRLVERFPAIYDDRSTGVFFIRPTQESWEGGDRAVVCVVEFLDGQRSGSVVD